MQSSLRKNLGVILAFHIAAIAMGAAMWRFDLPESLLILLVIPVLIAPIYFTRYVYATMSVGTMIISLVTLQNIMNNGIDTANLMTVLFLSFTVLTVAEVIYQVVNKLRKIQRRLKQSESRFRMLVENSPDAIIVLINEKIRFANSAAKKMLGISSIEDLQEKKGIDLLHPEDRERARKRSNLAMKGVKDDELDEFRLLRLDGKIVDVEAVAMPIEFEDEAGLQVVMRDVTDRNRVIQERQIMETQMRQAQKLESLGVLAGGIAHEFNNILVGIMGNAQLLLNDIPKEDPKRKHYLTIIDAAHRATGLCVQMRAYAGDEQSQSVIALEVSKEVLHIEKLLKVIGIDAIELKLELEDNLPRVKMDPAQLQQILITLVTNAAEAIGTTNGVITIKTGKKECHAAYLKKSKINENMTVGTYVQLDVKDNGSGIADEVLDKIFDPFFTTKFAGRGLGLAAVVGMVRACNGDIRVSSKPGEGSVFTVLLPAAQGPSPDAIESYSYTPEVMMKGEGTILYVDNDAAMCRYAKQVLERSGFTVYTTHDMVEGLEIFAEKQEELKALFLNPSIGSMQSTESWVKIRQSQEDIPFILLGTVKDEDMIEQFSNSLPARFLRKPFKRRDILLVLKSVFEEHETY